MSGKFFRTTHLYQIVSRCTTPKKSERFLQDPEARGVFSYRNLKFTCIVESLSYFDIKSMYCKKNIKFLFSLVINKQKKGLY